MALNDFFLFAFASLMLNITPGSDMLYVATRGTGQGTKAGILTGTMLFALGLKLALAGCIYNCSG